MKNKIKFFIDFYGDDFDKIYQYLFFKRRGQDFDILIKNSIYFFVEKDKEGLTIFLTGRNSYKFYNNQLQIY